MDYPNDDPLHAAKMRAAFARDKMGDAIDIAKWRLSPTKLRQDISAKRKQVTANIVARPAAIVKANPVAAISGIAMISLWLLRKPLLRAVPDILDGICEGRDALMEKLSGRDTTRSEQE